MRLFRNLVLVVRSTLVVPPLSPSLLEGSPMLLAIAETHLLLNSYSAHGLKGALPSDEDEGASAG